MPYFYYDSYYLVLVLPALIIAMIAQFKVQSTFKKYAENMSRRGKSAAQITREILDNNGLVHMAHMDIHFTRSTNGVAALHTEILKRSELANFHQLYPEKFNNKTNGITFRRWLLQCNPKLSREIEARIGTEFKQNADHLENLLTLVNDRDALRTFASIKSLNKKALAQWLYEKQGAWINPDAMFTIQAKRLHEYKRQQLNLLF